MMGMVLPYCRLHPEPTSKYIEEEAGRQSHVTKDNIETKWQQVKIVPG
jgi:hypothetical protein